MPNSSMKQLFLVGYFGAGNLGDEFLLEAFCSEIARIQSKTELYILSHSPDQNCDLPLPVKRLVGRFDMLGILRTISSVDALIFPGGSIFQDKSSLKSLIYYSALVFLAKLFRKKVFLIAQGLGPLKSPLSRCLCRLCFQMADYISLREGVASDLAELSKNVRFTQGCDLIWSLAEKINEKLSENLCLNPSKEKLIVISLRDCPELGQKELAYISRFIKQDFPQHKIVLWALQEVDISVLDRLRALLGKGEILRTFSPAEFWLRGLQILVRAELVVCMRFHALLLSMLCETSALAITHDPKLKNFCLSTGIQGIAENCLDTLSVFWQKNQYLSLSKEQLRERKHQSMNMSREVNRAALRDCLHCEFL